MGSEGEGIRQHAKQVAKQHKHENGKDEGEILLPFIADLFGHHALDEFVTRLSERLKPPWDHRAARGSRHDEQRDQTKGQ